MNTAAAQLTVGDAGRIGRAVAFADRLDRGGLNQTPQPHAGERPQPPPAWVVRVTGAVLSSGLYPAVVREFDMGSGSAAWQDAAGEEPCYAYHVTGAELASGDIAVGLLVGEDLEDGRSVFAVGPTTAPAAPVYGEARLTVTAVTLNASWQLIVEATIPSDGHYLVSSILSAVVEGKAGTHVSSFMRLRRGGVTAWVQAPVISACLQVDGKTADTVSGTVALPLLAGDKVQIMAGVAKPFGSPSPTYAKALGADAPLTPVVGTAVADLGGSSLDTRITYAKLSSDPGGTLTLPPPAAGAITGKVLVGDTGASGRTVTLSGATSGTATTDASGGFAFAAVNAGSHTLTLTLLSGETCTHQVDSGSVTSGNAAPVTVAAGVTHTVKFEVTSGGGGPDPSPGGGE